MLEGELLRVGMDGRLEEGLESGLDRHDTIVAAMVGLEMASQPLESSMTMFVCTDDHSVCQRSKLAVGKKFR